MFLPPPEQEATGRGEIPGGEVTSFGLDPPIPSRVRAGLPPPPGPLVPSRPVPASGPCLRSPPPVPASGPFKRRLRRSVPAAMPPISDPESLPLPPGHDRDWDRSRDRDLDLERSRDRSRRRRRRRRRLFPVLTALGAAALGAAAAAAALLGMLHCGMLQRGTPPQAATAAHMLLSAGSLSPPSSPLWRYEHGIGGVFLSGDVQATAGVLRVATAGLYLLYGQLALTCTAPSCPSGTVTLQLRRSGAPRPLLAVPLALSDGHGPVRSALVQAVRRLRAGERLSLALVGAVGWDGAGWQLAQEEREGNFVGLLRIAGDGGSGGAGGAGRGGVEGDMG
ncbi:psoriasis susceptibility 1 candidate gene 2 protein [Neopsephotus bourkii]|uniref:psoriasis susceptibility 1 candidate gene 2 protein n=1 Tax=Neopsephotus bourkii TaxID=309878 RepID=UPI002AA56782|nr:psoriasis susceptibility 1 candidate gene 2 protein [Neopsephotus bourkii]